MSKADRRKKRLSSVEQVELDEKVEQLELKRSQAEKIIKRVETQMNSEEYGNWSKFYTIEMSKKLNDAASDFLDSTTQLIFEQKTSDEQQEKNDTIDDLVTCLKSKLLEKLERLTPQVQPVERSREPVRVECIQMDAAGNIPNNWGKFDGDYAKWISFRDRWLVYHNNEKIQAVTKFTSLKTACVGAAEGALGEWDLTEDNYYKAWERLKNIYEDDYMQIQSYMQKLNKIPVMRDSSSETIRKILDTVHKHIHGLKRHIKMDEDHPYVVFAIIERMDADTYRAWEKYRRSIASQMVDENNEPVNSGKHVPTWKDMEQFLEGEVTIRVHAEKRGETDMKLQADQNNRRFKKNFRFKDANSKSNDNAPKCSVCSGFHMLHKCQVFKAMNLAGRKNHINENDLCSQCLQKNHEGPCANKKCNNECPKCKPKIVHHNSLIYPNTEIHVLLARESNNYSRKRKRQGNQSGNKFAKKPRPNPSNGKKEQQKQNEQATVCKVSSDWSLVPNQFNALKQSSKAISYKTNGESVTLLATLNIKIQQGTNFANNCRAIADTGATINCITKQFVEANHLTTSKCQRRILGVTGPEIVNKKIKAIIRPWFDSEVRLPIEFYVIPELNGTYPMQQAKANKDQILHIHLADKNFDIPAPVDALLGVEAYTKILGSDIFRHKQGALMHSTSFGHIVLGKFEAISDYSDNFSVNFVNFNEDDKNISNILMKFWQIEETNKCDKMLELSETEKAVEKIFMETFYREENGRYVVTIPIKPECKGLGDSRNIAFHQFLQLESRLERRKDIKEKYIEYMREFQNKGYMQVANDDYDPDYAYWIPHHAVESKFRVVVNASQITTNGESLNSIQMTGSKLQHDLQLQIMRFRKHKIGITTDITKMFNKIGLNEKQWNLQRIFWRESEEHDLKEYVFTVVMFGLASSPYNAVRTLVQAAREQENKFPQASKVIQTCFYMDDGLFGTDNISEAKILCKEIEFILNQANFTLKGWASNAHELEAYMNDAKNDEIYELASETETKVLGLTWLKSTDELSIAVKELKIPDKITKRNILEKIAELYDPNGFIAPVVVKAKMLMQDIWRLRDSEIRNDKQKQSNFEWDKEVPSDIKIKWLEFYTSLTALKEFKMKRWLGIKADQPIQIHAFCDASEKAYGISIYVRAMNTNGQVTCSLLSAKSRVTPIKSVSIPRLELLAAVMLSEQLEAILKACEFQIESITLWSDSSVVLHWLKKQPHELKAFVANRIKLIQDKTKYFTWKHVSSADNPADLVSRGMKVHDFLKSKLWLEGPSWLKLPENKWPTPRLTVSLDAKNEINKECKVIKNDAQILNVFSDKQNIMLYDKFQDWNKIINVTAYVFRSIKKTRESGSGIYLRPEERTQAIKYWIKIEQGKEFKKEIECLKNKERLPSKSKITSLRPMLDENGLLRVGGRIDKANIAYASRHQYIIPHKSRLSFLLISDAHKTLHHAGAQALIQFLRKSYWIPKLRQEAKIYIRTCVQCVREAQVISEQIMSELPEIRIKPAPPFQHVGVDMAGPYSMRITDKVYMNTRSRSLPEIKGWIAVFVCLVTRAIHLEPTEGMSTDDFLAAYQRFTSRRGNPEKVFSDNGTNFVGASNELQKAQKIWQAEKLQHFAQNNGTQWLFIPPSAPHEGGIWEAAVKSMKHHLKRVVGTQKYSIQAITTLLSSIEACLNSRPLCSLSDDPNDLEALTPAHFLIGRALKLPMHANYESPPNTLKRMFQNMLFQTKSFWKQWSEDYLQSLTQLPKWRQDQENMKIDQLVLIKSDNIAPTYWAMGRVKEVSKGTDGKIRTVTLQTQSGELVRSIRKLCVLPTDVEIHYWK